VQIAHEQEREANLARADAANDARVAANESKQEQKVAPLHHGILVPIEVARAERSAPTIRGTLMPDEVYFNGAMHHNAEKARVLEEKVPVRVSVVEKVGIALFGPPGSGKTTLCRELHGVDMESVPEAQREWAAQASLNVGMVVGMAGVSVARIPRSTKYVRVLLLPPPRQLTEQRRLRDALVPSKMDQPSYYQEFAAGAAQFDYIEDEVGGIDATRDRLACIMSQEKDCVPAAVYSQFMAYLRACSVSPVKVDSFFPRCYGGVARVPTIDALARYGRASMVRQLQSYMGGRITARYAPVVYQGQALKRYGARHSNVLPGGWVKTELGKWVPIVDAVEEAAPVQSVTVSASVAAPVAQPDPLSILLTAPPNQQMAASKDAAQALVKTLSVAQPTDVAHLSLPKVRAPWVPRWKRFVRWMCCAIGVSPVPEVVTGEIRPPPAKDGRAVEDLELPVLRVNPHAFGVRFPESEVWCAPCARCCYGSENVRDGRIGVVSATLFHDLQRYAQSFSTLDPQSLLDKARRMAALDLHDFSISIPDPSHPGRMLTQDWSALRYDTIGYLMAWHSATILRNFQRLHAEAAPARTK
jgi:energy-coupling factor transporter ATP-binding protein EcfA2